jgi:predicted permease
LTDLLIIFSNNLLPILLAAGAGFLVARYLGVTPKSVSQIAFYIFSPCLIFDLLTSSKLDGDDILQMVGYTIVVVLAIGVIAAIIGYVLNFERSILVALLLTVMFGNAGNYGLSLTLFSFGEDALAYASIYFATTAILVYTVGVVLASLGKSSLKDAFVGLFKVPVLYAVILALIFNRLDFTLPLSVDRTVSLLADAAIPVMLVLMGIQLYNSNRSKHTFAIGLSNTLRLVVSPVLAIGVGILFRLDGPAFQAGVLESAVPTAVLMTVLGIEYNIEPAFMTTAVFTSTLLSPLTVTPLLMYLGA